MRRTWTISRLASGPAGEQLERAVASTREVDAAIGDARRIISGMSLSRQ